MKRRPTTSRLLRTASAVLLVAAVSGATAGATTVPPDDTSDGSTPEPVDETVATDEVPFAVQPSGPNGPGGRDYFVYTLSTGQVFGDTVSVANLGDERATFVIYATDAFNTADGGFALLREEEVPTDVGSWIELGASQYTIEPGTRVDIPFRLDVPEDATPGDHAGAIVAQQIPETDVEGRGTQLEVRLRIGARVYVRVDGLLSPSLVIEDLTVDYDTPANPFGANPAKIRYVVRNTGNIRLSPTAELSIEGLWGTGRTEQPIRTIPELLPGSAIQISETVQDVRPLVRQKIRLSVSSVADEVSVERSISSWTIPWLGVVVPILVIGGFVGWRWWRRRSDASSSEAA